MSRQARGAQTLFAGYGEQWRRMSELGAIWFQPPWVTLNQEDVRETVERIAGIVRRTA